MDTDLLNIELSDHLEKCSGAVEAFKREIKKVRTGRASSGLVEGIVVDYYGSKTAISHLGQITVPEARVIVIQVYDSSAVTSIEKAIQTSGLGLNPSTDGNTIRLVVPVLTEESRRDLVKVLHKMAEDIKVSIRGHRRNSNDSLKKLEKDGDITKDDSKKALDTIQKQTDKYIAEIDKILTAKEAECLEV